MLGTRIQLKKFTMHCYVTKLINYYYFLFQVNSQSFKLYNILAVEPLNDQVFQV